MRVNSACVPAALAAVLVLAGPAFAGKIRVPKDHDTIQEAVDAASDGDTIEISSGTYDEDIEINGRSGLTLVGKGKARITGGSARLRLVSADDITIRGLTFENTPDTAIEIDEVADVTIEKCTFRRIGDDAIAGNTFDGLKVSGCSFDTTDDDCVDVDDGSDLVVEKCKMKKVGGSGIQVESVAGGKIEKNDIDDCGEDGIALSTGTGVQPSNDVLVAKNKIRRCGDDGIDAFGNRNVFEKNTVDDCGEDGIDVSDGDFTGNKVLKNKISKTDADGINLGGRDGVAEKNQVKSAGDDGIVLQGRGHRAEKNKVQGADDIGLVVTESSESGRTDDPGHHEILGNQFQKTAYGIELGTGAGDNTVDKNKVKKATKDGLVVQSTGNQFTKNDVRGSKGTDLVDESGGPNDYADNNKFGTERIDT